ncbi:hypothetical protein L484_019816 [Morus notabilis]|uniref:Protein MIZU-KUSSEI 1 n=1 Tax=Morus notabilis TaxID=981085 RepID=W9RU00_9ROSA|nr:protein MIZU-KUSSEI 1 [Morus notabilis]EXC09719.1 hypothetical protein L484_019816 [Morus notabilis]
MAYPTIGATTISSGVTVVDCQKQVRSWRLLRSLIELLIPCCNGTFIEDHHNQAKRQQNFFQTYFYYPGQPSNNVITGTIFGCRKGKVSFCIQSKATNNPILLLELAVSTQTLAREMRGGFLRIALESKVPVPNSSGHGRSDDLLSTPVWTMYCNGRRVGYAVKRRPSEADMEALRLMGSVVAGAGVINGKELNRDDDDELMYLRAKFERVCGSENSESFHLIDPDRCIGQELSVFFYRSR